MQAAMLGREKNAQLLIEHGADADAGHNAQETTLMKAGKRGLG